MYQLPRISRTWNPSIIVTCQSLSIAVRSVRASSRKSFSVRPKASSVRNVEAPELRNYFPVSQFNQKRRLPFASRDLVRAVRPNEGCVRRWRIASSRSGELHILNAPTYRTLEPTLPLTSPPTTTHREPNSFTCGGCGVWRELLAGRPGSLLPQRVDPE